MRTLLFRLTANWNGDFYPNLVTLSCIFIAKFVLPELPFHGDSATALKGVCDLRADREALLPEAVAHNRTFYLVVAHLLMNVIKP